jgi:hypothetical protein
MKWDMGTEIFPSIGDLPAIRGFRMERVHQSATQLQEVIKKAGYKADYKTVRKYLKELRERREVETIPGTRSRNASAYVISWNKLADHILHLVKAKQLDNFRVPPVLHVTSRGKFRIRKLLPAIR